MRRERDVDQVPLRVARIPVAHPGELVHRPQRLLERLQALARPWWRTPAAPRARRRWPAPPPRPAGTRPRAARPVGVHVGHRARRQHQQHLRGLAGGQRRDGGRRGRRARGRGVQKTQQRYARRADRLERDGRAGRRCRRRRCARRARRRARLPRVQPHGRPRRPRRPPAWSAPGRGPDRTARRRPAAPPRPGRRRRRPRNRAHRWPAGPGAARRAPRPPGAGPALRACRSRDCHSCLYPVTSRTASPDIVGSGLVLTVVNTALWARGLPRSPNSPPARRR